VAEGAPFGRRTPERGLAMEERDDDTAQTAREAKEARRFSDPTLEALRVQREAYAASGGQAAVIYDKLRDELAVAKRRLSATARGVEAGLDDKKLDEAERRPAVSGA
jgi:hypothetical protein